MFVVNEDNSIYVTRGDILLFSVKASNNGTPYTFKVGDVVRMCVVEKKAYENVVLQKDFPITTETTTVEIFLEEADTKIGETISKAKDYWYEIVLNPDTNPQTIVGYDDDGAKIFKLFPEGKDSAQDITEADIPFIDAELNFESSRPVENRVIAREFTKLNATVDALSNYVTPQMYGAKGDGVTDDTKAIKRALSESDRKVYFPKGVYIISDTITIEHDNISIVGENYQNTIIKSADNMNKDLLNVGMHNGITIDNIGFLNDYETNESGNCIVFGKEKVADGESSYGCSIQNIKIHKSAKSGLLVHNRFWVVNFNNIICWHCLESGILVLGSDNTYNNIYTMDCRFGMRIEASNNRVSNAKLIVSGQTCFDKDLNPSISAGIYITGCQRNQLVNVECQDSMFYGFWLSGCNAIEFHNCLSDGNANVNTYIESYTETNNKFENCSNMIVNIDNDDYTQKRVYAPFKMKDCSNILLNGTVSRITHPSVFENCVGVFDNTGKAEIITKLLNGKSNVENAYKLKESSGTYQNNVFTPASTQSCFKVSVDTEEKDVTLLLDIEFEKWVYRNAQFYENGVHQENASQVAIAAGRHCIQINHTFNEGVEKEIWLNFSVVQGYTIHNIACLTNVSEIIKTEYDRYSVLNAIKRPKDN